MNESKTLSLSEFNITNKTMKGSNKKKDIEPFNL